MSGFLEAPQLGSGDESDVLRAAPVNDDRFGGRDRLVAKSCEVGAGVAVGRLSGHVRSRTNLLYRTWGAPGQRQTVTSAASEAKLCESAAGSGVAGRRVVMT